MIYYHIGSTVLSNLVGGRGNGQIAGLSGNSPYSVEIINKKLAKHQARELKDLCNVEFEMRYDAKVTDIITGVMFDSTLWFVNLRFLKVIEKFNIAPYNIEPACLKHRNKYLEDYLLFQMSLIDYGLDNLDFNLRIVYLRFITITRTVLSLFFSAPKQNI